MFVKNTKSKMEGKKMTAVLYDRGRTKIKAVHFGATGYTDYTISHDKEMRDRYITRHKANENWGDPTSVGALSRYILWESTSLSTAISQYRQRFGLAKY